jgi:hypothetical protein
MAKKILAYIAVATLLLPLLSIAAPAFGSETTFGGRATGLSVNTALASTTLADTGPLPPEGGVVDATPAAASTELAQAHAMLSITMGGFDEMLQAEIAQSDVSVDSVVLLPGTPNQIEAYSVTAMSRATCSDVFGFSDITALVVAGQPITVTGEPNQVVDILGVLTLTINERIVTDNSITVNALHLHTALGADVIVSSASSSISCGTDLVPDLFQTAFGWGAPSTPGCVDFTTGGGWVKPPPNKGTFGFVAGYRPGGSEQPRGNLEYHDHTYGLNLHALDVLYYNCGIPDNSRVFGGHARVNGVPGYCYQVYVEDRGEPGNKGPKDYFAMWVWASPEPCTFAGGAPGTEYYAVGNELGGGNIQIHKFKNQ